MPNEGTMVKDSFLEALRQENKVIAVFLVNGIKLLGQLIEFDDEVIILSSTNKQMIFRHAISTIMQT